LAGTAESVAQQLIEWLELGACDGYVVSPAYLPGTFTEFTESVVPILQRRGYLRSAYEHPTLRGHLGLKKLQLIATARGVYPLNPSPLTCCSTALQYGRFCGAASRLRSGERWCSFSSSTHCQ
jgi:hypothetical protein